MNRFFSKLDLRDIKIDTGVARYTPEDDIVPDDLAPVATSEPEPAIVASLPDRAELDADGLDQAVPAAPGGVLKVSARSRPSAVAGAIAGVVRARGRADVQAIGAGATNQAVKAVAIAREYLRETGIEAVCLPSFIDVAIDGEDRTAILLVVETR